VVRGLLVGLEPFAQALEGSAKEVAVFVGRRPDQIRTVIFRFVEVTAGVLEV